MSLYVQWMNLIKERATVAWLTESQRVVYSQLLAQWQSSSFVNIYGPVGSGKSFLARMLVSEHGYAYASELQSAPAGSLQVIVDDAQYSRIMRATAQLQRLGRVILLTQVPVREPMPRAQIRLTERDIAQGLHNLYAHCGISFTSSTPQGTDLAQIIRNEVIARGGSNAG